MVITWLTFFSALTVALFKFNLPRIFNVQNIFKIILNSLSSLAYQYQRIYLDFDNKTTKMRSSILLPFLVKSNSWCMWYRHSWYVSSCHLSFSICVYFQTMIGKKHNINNTFYYSVLHSTELFTYCLGYCTFMFDTKLIGYRFTDFFPVSSLIFIIFVICSNMQHPCDWIKTDLSRMKKMKRFKYRHPHSKAKIEWWILRIKTKRKTYCQ